MDDDDDRVLFRVSGWSSPLRNIADVVPSPGPCTVNVTPHSMAGVGLSGQTVRHSSLRCLPLRQQPALRLTVHAPTATSRGARVRRMTEAMTAGLARKTRRARARRAQQQ